MAEHSTLYPGSRVISLLDAGNVPYRLLPHRQPVFTVVDAARERGVQPGERVKSILLRESARARLARARLAPIATPEPDGRQEP